MAPQYYCETAWQGGWLQYPAQWAISFGLKKIVKKNPYQHLIAGVTLQAAAGTLCTIWSEMWAVLEGWIAHSLGRALRKGKMLQKDNSVPALSSPSLTRKIRSGNHAKARPILLQSHVAERWGLLVPGGCMCSVSFEYGIRQKMETKSLLQTLSTGRKMGGCSVSAKYDLEVHNLVKLFEHWMGKGW